MKTILLISSLAFINIFPTAMPMSTQDAVVQKYKINSSIEDDIASWGWNYTSKYQDFINEHKEAVESGSDIFTTNPELVNFFAASKSINKNVYYVLDSHEQDLDAMITYKDLDSDFEYTTYTDLTFIDSDENLYLSRYTDNLDNLPNQVKELSNYQVEVKVIKNIRNIKFPGTPGIYEFNTSAANNINNSYLDTENSFTQKLNQGLTITLNNPHVWSYNFDKDSTMTNVWEEFKSLFGFEGDTLDNQIFYSFTLPSGWNLYEISDITISYYKTLLLANSYDTLSNIDDFNYFDQWSLHASSGYINNPDPRATYWSWSDDFYDDNFTFTNNNLLNNYLSNYLGGSKEQAIESFEKEIQEGKLSATTLTISADEINSTNIGNTSYSWKKIQTNSSFKDAFSENPEIIEFASEFMPNDNYYVINFDNFLYKYSTTVFSYSTRESMEELSSPDYLNFYDYLKNNNAEFAQGDSWGISGGYYNGFKYYQNIIEMPLKVSAKEMTLLNSQTNENIHVNINVESADLEDTGGNSEKPVENITDKLKTLWQSIKDFFSNSLNVVFLILGIIGLLLIIAAIGWIINLFKSKK